MTLKIRLRPFRTYTRSRTVDEATSEAAVIGGVARELLESFEIDAPVRLLGVGVSTLVRPEDAEVDAQSGAATQPPALSLDV